MQAISKKMMRIPAMKGMMHEYLPIALPFVSARITLNISIISLFVFYYFSYFSSADECISFSVYFYSYYFFGINMLFSLLRRLENYSEYVLLIENIELQSLGLENLKDIS